MEFSIKTDAPEKIPSGVLVVGVHAGGKLADAAQRLDKVSGGRLTTLLKRGDLPDKPASALMLHDLPGVAAERVLLLSLGEKKTFDDNAFRKILAAVGRALANGVAGNAAIALADMQPAGRETGWCLRQAVGMLADAAYRYAPARSGKPETPKGAQKCVFLLDTAAAPFRTAVKQGQALAEGMALTKDLGNLPANVCTPTHLAKAAIALGKQFKFGVKALERPEIEKLGMGAILSVARGSDEPPRFIVLEYKGAAAKTKPVVLVGKGVTFDSGGISLKPGPGMDEMKFDMCGAASVLGVFKAVARLGLPVNLVGLIPATENLPDGRATKPGDVVASLSGQTIEILNTDAEGRLILCDALTYAERFKPDCVIDIATLTGACVIALGKIPSGLFANDDALAQALLQAGQMSGDRVWQLPLWEEYQDALKSNFADMANVGGRDGGAITAASFLSRFTGKYAWAHLDIAGTAWRSGEAKGATGRPVPLLFEFLLQRVNAG